MIKTVTLNPAIDKTIEINDFRINAVNRAQSVRLDAGGKGINVSKLLKVLRGESKAYGILAGKNGEFIKNYLDQSGIENDFLFIEGETRVNLKVVDRLLKTNTDINEPGLKVSGEDILALEKMIFSGDNNASLLILSGSIPPGVPTDIYKKWTNMARESGIKTILDGDGELLRKGIEAGPYLIKPNIHELERLLNKELKSIDEIAEAARGLQDFGIEIIVVSLGSKGALYINRDSIIHAEGIKVEVKSTVGAGDSMVAALAFALDRGYSFERAVTLSIASGAANVTTSGTEPPRLEDILNYEKQVSFRYL